MVVEIDDAMTQYGSEAVFLPMRPNWRSFATKPRPSTTLMEIVRLSSIVVMLIKLVTVYDA